MTTSTTPHPPIVSRDQKGWTIPWFSSFDSDFNYDFHVTLDENTAPPEDNYRN
jgi:predicted dithiol-disulfide oxidoreductase (DUF899 family)